MPWTLWTYDAAREQCPSQEQLLALAAVTRAGGYDALGLYLEHRFAYPSVPWAHGTGSLSPEAVRALIVASPELEIVPFVNLLGHMEGFLYTQEGQRFAEEPMQGMQGNLADPGFVELCHDILDDTLATFDSEVVHIGGDETAQLGRHPASRAITAGNDDAKAWLYGHHFKPLCERILQAGRRPALWADMLLEHPTAASGLPRDTLLFDWQYRSGIRDSTPRLAALGFEVVGCPTLHVYDAPWCHLTESEGNIREVATDAHELGIYGTCLTTWECGLFGAYDTILPAVGAAGQILRDPAAPALINAYGDDRRWVELMSDGLAELGGVFAFDGHRHRLKSRLLLFGNPFLAWRYHGDELSGPSGDRALQVLDQALGATLDPAMRSVTIFVRSAVEFVRIAERARAAYAADQPETAVVALMQCRIVFETLARIARQTHGRTGGSLADIERCLAARDHVERVVRRIRTYGNRELGYLPAFEVITHPNFVAHDQASWWIVNSWGRD